MRPGVSPGALADRLAALPVRIVSLQVHRGAVPLDDYPGEPRPTSSVRLSGGGCVGWGENVAFTAAEHQRFATRAHALLAHPLPEVEGKGAGSADARAVGEWVTAAGTSYERAALEAALVDLALRQAGKTLAEVAGVTQTEVALRFVASFAASASPVTRVRELRSQGYRGDLKIDVAPEWQSATREALAKEPGIAILDFKGRGDARLVAELARLFPGAIFEDPPDGGFHAHTSRDAVLGNATAVAAAVARGETVNLKAPRMGGPLELLRGLQHVWSSRRPLASDGGAYVGGMFEVAVGRAQARQLAALFCAEAPNDLAPHRARPAPPANPPAQIRLDGPGFGAGGY